MWWPPQSAGNVQSFCFNKKHGDQPACMCFCMHVALFDCGWKRVCRCLRVFCMHVFFLVCNYVSVPRMCVCVRVRWMFRGGARTHKNTEVGNILMSTVKQEIGNTFKSLALNAALRSQPRSPREPGIACDRVHRGIALYPLRV